MKNLMTKTAMVACLAALAACGGGGGGGSSTPAPTPTPVTVPGANAPIAQMIDFAKQGSATPKQHGVMTFSHSAGGVVIKADEIPGYGVGLVTRMENGQATVFNTAGNPLVTTATPSGVYTGGIEMNYRMTENGQWQTALGDMAIVLDLANGTAGVDSIVGNANNNIEFMGEAQVANGRLSMTDAMVNLRDGQGAMISQERGTMNGIIATGSDTTAITGTVGSSNATTGFDMNGGFLTTYDPRHN